MVPIQPKLRTAWQAVSRFLRLAEPDDPRNRPRQPPGPWPLRQPALVGRWRARIGGGVEWCWHPADRSATVLPFAPRSPREHEDASGGGGHRA